MLILQLLAAMAGPFIGRAEKFEEDEGGDGVVGGIKQEHQGSNLL